MKKIGLFLLLLITLQTTAQIRVCQLPQTSTGTVHDWIIKEDSTCVGTRKITVQDFMTAYGITSSSSGNVASFSSGNLSPLFTTSVANSTTNPALSFSLSSVAAHKWYGNATGSSGVPSFSSMDTTEIANFSSKVRGLFTGYSPVSYSNGGISVDTSAGGSHLATQYYVSQHSGSGSITSITASAPLTGGTITTSGTIGVDTSAGGSHLATQYYVDSHSGGGGDMTKAVYDVADQQMQVIVTPYFNIKATMSVDTAMVFDQSNLIEGQTYVITNDGATQLPTGIGRVTLKAVTQDAGVIQWDDNAEAWVSGLGRYVPCRYDVATNTIQGEYVLWAGYLSQSGGGAPTVDSTAINISGETPTISYLSAGDYTIVFTGGQIISDVKCQTFTANYFDGADSWISYCNYYTANEFRIQAYKIANNGLRDDGLNHTYIQIKINL